MSKDIELRIEITHGDVCVERIISNRTTIRVDSDNKLELDEEQIASLYKALTAYAKADGIEL